MLSAPHPAAFVWSLALSYRHRLAGLFLFLLLLAVTAPVRAQGAFTTKKPFALSTDAAHHFTLTSIPVVYKPLNGKSVSGFLTLSGTPADHSLRVFTNIQLAFSPKSSGAATITDTFPLGIVTLVHANLYHLASAGASLSGNTFNLYGGTRK